MRHAVILAAVLLAAGGCRCEDAHDVSLTKSTPSATTRAATQHGGEPAGEPAPPAGTQSAARAAAGAVTLASELEALIANHGSVTFSSHNGKWIGGDNDADITFLPGGAHMFLYSDALLSYSGTFTLDADGTIVARFPTMEGGGGWPPTLLLGKDGTSLLLTPKEEADRPRDSEGRETYWPFRQDPAADEARKRKEIKKYQASQRENPPP